jgi:hypothetical protein
LTKERLIPSTRAKISQQYAALLTKGYKPMMEEWLIAVGKDLEQAQVKEFCSVIHRVKISCSPLR